MTADDLLDKLNESGTDERNDAHNLEIAVHLLARKELLEAYKDLLRGWYKDVPEYAWLNDE